MCVHNSHFKFWLNENREVWILNFAKSFEIALKNHKCFLSLIWKSYIFLRFCFFDRSRERTRINTVVGRIFTQKIVLITHFETLF